VPLALLGRQYHVACVRDAEMRDAIMENASLPEAVSRELLQRYADVLRVGRVMVNGELVTWETSTSTELQLKNFCQELFLRLSHVLPELAEKNPVLLRFAAYWFCKSVSLNYALIEVLLMIKQRVGVLCSIETRGSGIEGGLVEYSLDATPGSNNLKAAVSWRKANNIVYLTPERHDVQVKGTLSRLTTEFHLPPEEGFLPAYCLQMRLRKSLAATVVSKLACGGASQSETIFIDEPLRSHHPLQSFAELVARPSNNEAVPVSRRVSRRDSEQSNQSMDNVMTHMQSSGYSTAASTGSADSSSNRAQPRDVLATSWKLGEESLLDRSDSTTLLGLLCVRILRARIQDSCMQERHVRERQPQLYATCTLAGRTERTQIIPDSFRPEWLQAFHFPLMAVDLREDVIVEVFDDSVYGDCDQLPHADQLEFIGRATVPVSTALSDTAAIALTEPLRASGSGSIDLELELLPSSDTPAVKETDADDAPFLRHPDGSDTYDGECNLELGSRFPPPIHSRHETKAVAAKRGQSPLGFSVKVRSASPKTGARSIWCTKGCTFKSPE